MILIKICKVAPVAKSLQRAAFDQWRE